MKNQSLVDSASIDKGSSRLGRDMEREVEFRTVGLTGMLLSFVLVLILVATGVSVQNRPASKNHIDNLTKQHIDHIETLARNHIRSHIEQHI